jgi:predicted membrane GTPase involved in stress response
MQNRGKDSFMVKNEYTVSVAEKKRDCDVDAFAEQKMSRRWRSAGKDDRTRLMSNRGKTLEQMLMRCAYAGLDF